MKSREVLTLYKRLLRESQKFQSYNYREYALRRVRDGFRDNKTTTDVNKLNNLYVLASENLDVIKRQVSIGQMFSAAPLVIENSANRQFPI